MREQQPQHAEHHAAPQRCHTADVSQAVNICSRSFPRCQLLPWQLPEQRSTRNKPQPREQQRPRAGQTKQAEAAGRDAAGGGPCPGTTEPLQHPGCFGTGHTALACQDSVGTLSFGQLFPPFLCLQSNMSQPGRQAKQRSCPAVSALSPRAVLFQQKPYSMQINHPIPCKPAQHWVLPTRPPSPGVQRALQPVYPDFNRPLQLLQHCGVSTSSSDRSGGERASGPATAKALSH